MSCTIGSACNRALARHPPLRWLSTCSPQARRPHRTCAVTPTCATDRHAPLAGGPARIQLRHLHTSPPLQQARPHKHHDGSKSPSSSSSSHDQLGPEHEVDEQTKQRIKSTVVQEIKKMTELTPEYRQLADDLLAGDRYALSRAITLVESSTHQHREQSNHLLSYCLTKRSSTNNRKRQLRIGITGTPGVGKSTFIEAIGNYIVNECKLKLAVLSIDPSSRRTGGSILGDKTRMTELSRAENAFIRPSPSGGQLGGVASGTADALMLVEAAGYDVTIIETVGVGQSEVSVVDMVDMFVLLVAPAGGDELQGIKKGIVEVADLIVVNKADGDLQNTARHTKSDYMHAVQLLPIPHHEWQPEVVLCSCFTKNEKLGVTNVWKKIMKYYAWMDEKAGKLEEKRAGQRVRLLYDYMYALMLANIKRSPDMAVLVSEVEKRLRDNKLVPRLAAQMVLQQFASKQKVS